MAHKCDENEQPPTVWFAARRFGYGAGLPITWQGWVSLCLFLAVTLASSFILPFFHFRHPLYAAAGVMVLNLGATVAFGWVCYTHTQGGWRWRWGDSD